jgi:tRNA nucleotidyltransferase (CCA-adding enzyme)
MRELGLAPGRLIGELLGLLLEDVVSDPAANGKERLIALARDYIARRG